MSSRISFRTRLSTSQPPNRSATSSSCHSNSFACSRVRTSLMSSSSILNSSSAFLRRKRSSSTDPPLDADCEQTPAAFSPVLRASRHLSSATSARQRAVRTVNSNSTAVVRELAADSPATLGGTSSGASTTQPPETRLTRTDRPIAFANSLALARSTEPQKRLEPHKKSLQYPCPWTKYVSECAAPLFMKYPG